MEYFLNKKINYLTESQNFIPMKIISTGVALPPNKVTANELDKILKKPLGYSLRYSGIEYRYLADDQLDQATLAVEALNNALQHNNISIESIDLLISASAIPIQALPYSAAHIINSSHLPSHIAGLDINVSCASFITALHTASCLLNSNTYKRIAIVCSELASRGLDWNNEESSMIFGDGAACVILEKGDGTSGILSYLLETHTNGIELCQIKAGGTKRNLKSGMMPSDFLFQMQSKSLFKLAATLIEPFFEKLLESSKLTLTDMNTIIPHQASHLSLEHMRRRLKIPKEIFVDIYRFRGNQIAASIPSALHDAIQNNRLKPQQPTMLIGTAAGLTLAGMILLP